MAPAKAVSKSMTTNAFYSHTEENTSDAQLPRYSGLIMPVEPNAVPATNGKGRGRGKKANKELAVEAATPNEMHSQEKPTKKAPGGRRGAKTEAPVAAVTDTAQQEPAENGKRAGGRARGKKAEEAIADKATKEPSKVTKEPAKGRGKKEAKPAAAVEESTNGEQQATNVDGGEQRKGRKAIKDEPVATVKEEPKEEFANKPDEPVKGRGKKETKPATEQHTNGFQDPVDGEEVVQPQITTGRKGRKLIKDEPVAVVKEEPVTKLEMEQIPAASSTKKAEKPKRGKRAAPTEEPVEDINAIAEASEESPKKKSKRDKKEAKKLKANEENDANSGLVDEQKEDEVAAKPSKEQQKAVKSTAKAAEKAAKKNKQEEKLKEKDGEILEEAAAAPSKGKTAKKANKEEAKVAEKAAKEQQKAAQKAAKAAEKAAKEAAKKLAKEEKKKDVKAKTVNDEAEEANLPTVDVAITGKKGGRGNRKRGADVDQELAADEQDADHAQPPKNKKGLMNAAETIYNEADFSLPPEKAALFNLKISSWNVAGLRAWLKKDGLKFLEYEQPDIFCLQEIKCTEDQLPEEAARIPGYHPYWATMPGGSNGVAIYSKIMPINVEYGIGSADFDGTGRIITAEYEKFYLINTYVPNSGRKLVNLESRMKWEELFLAYLRNLDAKKPVVICGDMNVSHLEIDLANPKSNTRSAGFTKEERDKMTALLACGFVDTFRELYPDQKGAYTFWTYLGNARARNVGWRLDYFIVSERFAGRVVDNCIRAQCKGSDHCPITLFLKL